MIKVFQNVMGSKRGNCGSACWASILHLDINEVPNFHDAKDYIKAERKFLSKFGLDYVTISLYDGGKIPDVWHIMTGKSPRFNVRHAVVGFGGKIMHDPSPEGGGILEESFTHPDGEQDDGKISYIMPAGVERELVE